MLGHLAVCPECRAVVALSLPEVEVPEPTPRAVLSKPWWAARPRPWTLAWTVAGALAAALFLAVLLHRGTRNDAGQEAAVKPLAGPPPSGEPMRAPGSGEALRTSKATPPAIRQSSALASAAAPSQAAPSLDRKTPAAPQSPGGLSLTGRNFAALRSLHGTTPSSPATGAEPVDRLAAQPGPGQDAGAASGMAKSLPSNAPYGGQPSPQKPSAGLAGASAQTEPAPAPAAAETVAVTASAPMETVSVNAANVEIVQNQAQAQITRLARPLPSRLPVLSLAMRERRVVAIDTAHAVFVSKDAGKHWKAIQAPWQGLPARAVLVEASATARAPSSQPSGFSARPMPADNAVQAQKANGSLAPPPAPAPSAKAPSLGGTVADATGAAIPGASVTVTDTATGSARTVQSDAAGRYLVDGIAPSTYRVEARSPGFATQMLAAVPVPSAGQAIANLVLSPGAATQTVEVQADSSLVPLEDKANRKSPSHAAPEFEITTDNGSRWTSTDGIRWKPM
jgi:hypothetical protein